jgi:hypothetical protein
MSDEDHPTTDAEHDRIGVIDLHQFWSAARSAMLTLTLCIAVFKVGLTLIWCSFNGIDINLRFWWHLVPYFELGLDQPSFVRAVTVSSWLGALGMAVGFVVVAVAGRRATRTLTERSAALAAPAATDPAQAATDDTAETAEMNDWVSYAVQAHRAGRRIGACTGATTLLITVIFELVRDRVFGAYVLPSPHLFLITAAGIPPLAAVGMLLSGWFDRSVDFEARFPLVHRTHVASLASE